MGHVQWQFVCLQEAGFREQLMNSEDAASCSLVGALKFSPSEVNTSNWSDVSLTFLWCFSDVSLTFLWCFSDVSLTFLWRFSDVSLMFLWRFSDVSLMFLWRFSDVSLTFLWCFSDVSLMFLWCFSAVSVPRFFNCWGSEVAMFSFHLHPHLFPQTLNQHLLW